MDNVIFKLNIENDNASFDIKGEAVDIIAHLCAFFHDHQDVLNLMRNTIEAYDAVVDNVEKDLLDDLDVTNPETIE